MTQTKNPIVALRKDCAGSVVVEFAILGPVLLTMLFGVLQFGIGMQNYNALRSVSAEVARFAVIDAQDAAAQSDMTMRDTNNELEAYAREVASAAPYGLQADRLTNRFRVLHPVTALSNKQPHSLPSYSNRRPLCVTSGTESR